MASEAFVGLEDLIANGRRISVENGLQFIRVEKREKT